MRGLTGCDGKNENSMKEFLLETRQVKSGKQKPKSREELQWHIASAATVTHIHVQTLARRKGVHMSQHYLCSRGNDEDKNPGYHACPDTDLVIQELRWAEA